MGNCTPVYPQPGKHRGIGLCFTPAGSGEQSEVGRFARTGHFNSAELDDLLDSKQPTRFDTWWTDTDTDRQRWRNNNRDDDAWPDGNAGWLTYADAGWPGLNFHIYTASGRLDSDRDIYTTSGRINSNSDAASQ